MNKDKDKKIDDKFKKYIIESLPEFVPDKNKIDIANICSDVVDLLDNRQTNNTIVALDILGNYYRGMFFNEISKEYLDSSLKELNDLLENFVQDNFHNKSEAVH